MSKNMIFPHFSSKISEVPHLPPSSGRKIHLPHIGYGPLNPKYSLVSHIWELAIFHDALRPLTKIYKYSPDLSLWVLGHAMHFLGTRKRLAALGFSSGQVNVFYKNAVPLLRPHGPWRKPIFKLENHVSGCKLYENVMRPLFVAKTFSFLYTLLLYVTFS